VELDGDVTIVRLSDPKLHEMILITELHDELLQYIEHHHPQKLLGLKVAIKSLPWMGMI
jgi:hypothetical protein